MILLDGKIILIGLCLCKFFLVQHLSAVTTAPLVVALFISLILAIINGIKLQNGTDGIARGRIQLVAAADIILFCLAINRTDITAFSFYQLLTATNYSNRNRIRNLAHIVVGLLGYILYPSAKLLDLGLVFLYRFTNTEYIRLKNQCDTSSIVQSEFWSAQVLTMMLLLIAKDSGSAFIGVFYTNALILVIGVAAGIVFYGCRQLDSDEPRLNLVTSVSLSLLALFFQKSQLVRSIVAVLIATVGAYTSLDDGNAEDDVIERPVQPPPSSTSTTKVTTIILVLTLCVLVGHLNEWNAKYLATLDSRPAMLDHAIILSAKNEGVQKQLQRQCLHKTKDLIIRSIGPLIRPDRDYAHFDMPEHLNLGDSFIFAGNELLLRSTGQLGQRGYPPYTNPKPFGKIFTGTALYNGGGNFGDLYRVCNRMRANGVANMPNAAIVFLPQSIHYRNTSFAVRDNQLFAKHPDLIMTFRDLESLAFSREYFPTIKSKYTPDMAWMLGPQLPNTDPVVDILVLLRYDLESSQPVDKSSKPDYARSFRALQNQTLTAVHKYPGVTAEVWDFPALHFPVLKDKNTSEVYFNYSNIYPGRILPSGPKTWSTSDANIQFKTAMGNTLLSRGRVIITDRLHASVMGTLLGRPVVFIENIYRKISRVRGSLAAAIDECSDSILNAKSARTIEESVALAVDYLKKMKKG